MEDAPEKVFAGVGVFFKINDIDPNDNPEMKLSASKSWAVTWDAFRDKWIVSNCSLELERFSNFGERLWELLMKYCKTIMF